MLIAVQVLRPFLWQTAVELKRIAELLSQLPPDIDVEVGHTLITYFSALTYMLLLFMYHLSSAYT